MSERIHRQPRPIVTLVLVFLCLACNEKQIQNTDSTQKSVTPAPAPTTKQTPKNRSKPHKTPKPAANNNNNGETPFIVGVIGSKFVPALVTGRQPIYVSSKKTEDADSKTGHWELATEEESGDKFFRENLNSERAPSFDENKSSNEYGLYFGDFRMKRLVNICGTKDCKTQPMKMEMLILRTTPEQFEKLFTQAVDLTPDVSMISEWNLYFFDSKIEKFQVEETATLSFHSESESHTPSIAWNGLFNNNEKTDFKNDPTSPLQLKFSKLGDREMIVGKYTSDGVTYPIIGTRSIQFVD